jgi:glycosyltransferase involved in cell wall biosynthesis
MCLRCVEPQPEQSVSIIVCAYNEGGNLRQAVRDILAAATALDDYEILIVNDGSIDATPEVADHLAREYPRRVRVIHHSVNLGLRAAYESGLSAASRPYTVWLPGDGEMAAHSIRDIFKAVGSADLILPYHGTPERRPWFRRALTWISTTQLNTLLGHRLHYYQGTVVYPTPLARRLPRTEAGFFFAAEMLAHALEDGPTYTEIPLTHVERTYGVSKAVSWRAIWRGQMAVLRIAWAITVNRMSAQARAALSHA